MHQLKLISVSLVILLVIGLVLIVRLGIHLPTIFRGFLFYIQVSSVAVAYLPKTFRLRTDVVSKKLISERAWYYHLWWCHYLVTVVIGVVNRIIMSVRGIDQQVQ